jgi:UDP:flavonoid glycosyltransferase YjiC (YdhE family)
MNLLIPLFSPAIGAWGGLTRAVAMAHAAEAAGHHVAFCASGYLAHNLRGRGFRVYAMPAPTLLGLPKPLSWLVGKLLGQALSGSLGSIWQVLYVSGVAIRRSFPHLAEAELRAARAFGADAIFTDLDPGAFLIARSLNVPVATAYASAMVTGSGSWAWRQTRRTIAPLLKRCGLPALTPDELFFGEDVLKLVPSIPALDGIDATRADVRYVGHLLGAIQPQMPAAFQPEPGQRYVFCYMGSGSVALADVRRVLPEVFADGARLCVVAGYGVQRQERLGNVLFIPYVDVRTLLPHCDWTVSHGGQNTIVQSLQAGVPLLIFPGGSAERRQNAARVQALGAGWLGEPTDWNPAWLRERLTDRARAAAVAARLGAEIEALGGAPAAVRALEEWVRRAVWRRENLYE